MPARMETMKLHQTKYYGIEVQEDQHGFYVFSSAGDEMSLDHFPTDAELAEFAEECRYYNQ
jgi:hypothetical protein